MGECKWKEDVDPDPIIKGLIRKTQFIHYNKKQLFKNYEYAVFAKSFQNNQKIEWIAEKRVYCIDLQELEAICTNTTSG